MSKKIFRSIVLVAIIIWAACFALFLQVLYSYFSKEYMSELKTEANIIAASVNKYGEDYLNSLQDIDIMRITLIDADGNVLFDNVSKADSMENHSDREEFLEALENGYGDSTRYSSTISEKTIYYALRLENEMVIRVSRSYYSAWTLIVGMGQPIAIIALLSIILALILAFRITKSIINPINEINLEKPASSDIYEELTPFVDKIERQNALIKRQMQDLKHEHSEREKMRSEFTANISHELKTPLTSISGYAEIIRNGIASSEDIPRFAGKIYDEAGRLIILVEDIMKLSKLDENALPAKKEYIDLYNASEAAIAHLQSAADSKNIKVTLKGEHAEIFGADQVIDEMIYNLCDNAIKYNKENGSITVSVTSDSESVTLSVEDTGIGIAEEDFEHIFERFYRVNKSHSKKIGGTGLGLSIVKHGARYHNATINVESCLDKGTKISIIFPK